MSSPTTAALKRKHASPARRSFEVAASASDKSDKKYIPGGPIANALVVVTGANRGIGLEFCKQILAKSDGNSVVASCRDPSAATDLTALQKEMGASRLAIVALDVADEKSIAKWAEGLAALEPVKAQFARTMYIDMRTRDGKFSAANFQRLIHSIDEIVRGRRAERRLCEAVNAVRVSITRSH
jgi:NAD(P)-dependent dehydrogenase (short-subunit alcohol dehydrogenase family)